VENPDIPDIKRTKLKLYLTAPEAAAMKDKLGDKALFVDIRTKGEAMFVGTPASIDAVVPYVEFPDMGQGWDETRSTYKLEPNNDVSPELARRLAQKGLTKSDVVILICRSGDRSAAAINHQLADSGYTQVYSVIDGFEGDMSKDGRRSVNGWKNAGLPWVYKLDRAKAYLPK
jgi:rhodanese-related sulfurtransferase